MIKIVNIATYGRKEETPEYKAIRDLAIEQLLSGKSLTGKGGVFAPMLKEFLDSAREGEMESHLDETERSQENKRNGKGSKMGKTSVGEIPIKTQQYRHSSFEPQIIKKQETTLADPVSQNHWFIRQREEL